MSRFRDLWASGKFSIDKKGAEVVDKRAEHEAANMLRELIPDESQKLFTDLKQRRGAETGKWLRGLGAEVGAVPREDKQAQASSADGFEDARRWIDALFQEFASLTYIFNQNAVGTKLFVSCERPQLVETKDETVWYNPVTKTYLGRLATRQWCLFVRGDDKKISMYIFPVEMTIGFKSGTYGDDTVPPFLVAEPGANSGKKNWVIQGEEAPLSVLPALAKEMFGDLIRVASGAMGENELFTSHQHKEPKLGENVAVGYVAETPSAADASSAISHLNVDGLNIHDACDLVDKVIDLELKRLYQEAAKQSPGTPAADKARKQISAVEAFRMRIVDSFEKFTHESQGIQQEKAVGAGKA
ncbi:MAG TPA: hypothetical protein EYN91_10245 [Candidatus Melainabacteria bacterium]|jgi:hypothetical protein|nr:hypothetical protein [Candidatus Melainabacteria bacterium]HIN67239.1 hypothetical protein [Candidatus Obscuribacterales bacterium]